MSRNIVLTSALTLMMTGFAAEARAYTYTEIIVPGLGSPLQATAINNRGDIVGFGTLSGTGSGTVGFLDSAGVFTLLSFPGSTNTLAWGINDAGDIVGSYQDSSGTHGFKYSGGVWTTVDAPAPEQPNSTELTAINNLGQIAGGANGLYPNNPTGSFSKDSFVDNGGTFSILTRGPTNELDIAGLNDSGEFTGLTSGVQQPFWPIYGYLTSYFMNDSFYGGGGINDGGQVTSTSSVLSNPAQTTPGTPVAFPGARFTQARGINNAGSVVGYWEDNSTFAQHAFVAVAAAPTCIVGTSPGPPDQMNFSVQDTSGLAQIAASSSLNATTTIPVFVAGTTSPVLVTSNGTNPALSASVALTATNTSGASSVCSASIGGNSPSSWQTLGGILTSDIAVGTNQDGSLDAFALGSDSTLWHIAQSGPAGPWGSWGGFGSPAFAGEPAVAMDSAGQLEILAIDSDGTLWQISQTAPANWSGSFWSAIASGVKGRPALIQNGNQQLQAFARTVDDSLITFTQSSPASSAWTPLSLGGVIISNPAAILSGVLAEAIAIGADRALWTTDTNQSGQQAAWKSLGGSLQGDPVFVSGFDIIARGTDNGVWHNYNSSGSGWENLGGQIVDDPLVIRNYDLRLEVFAAGSDNAVWRNVQTVGGGNSGGLNLWTGWSTLSGVILGNVTPALDASRAVNLFLRGSDNGLWYMTQTAPGRWQ